MGTITEDDRKAAAKIDLCCGGLVETCEQNMDIISQAIADAREAGEDAGAARAQRELYSAVCDVRCTAHGGEGDGCPCLAAAEQTVARWAP